MKKLSFFLMAMLISVMSFAAEATATLSFANKAQRTVFNSNQQVWEQNGITLTNDKASSSSAVADYYNPARFYKSSKITIKCTLGTITQIVFDCNSSSYATALKSSITSGTATVSSDKVTVVPATESDEYVIASLTGGQVRMDALTVTYVVAEEDPDLPVYTITATSADATMGTVAGSGEYKQGKTVTLTANANPGYEFVKWSNESTDNPLVFEATENLELTANFQAQTPISIAEAVQLAEGATCVLKEFNVAYVYKSYIHIQDETGYTLAFKYDYGLKAGDKVTGFTASKTTYNGLVQLVPTSDVDALTVVEGVAPAVPEVTTAPTGNYQTVVKLVNVQMPAGSFDTSNNKTVTATCPDGTKINVYNNKNITATFTADKTYNVTGCISQYNNVIQVIAYAVEEYVAPEPEIEWIEMPLEITNLTTEVMEVEGAKYLLLQGRDDMNDADVMLFLNNYADVDDDYEVNAESSYMTFGGMELTVLEGVMTQTSETDKGTIYTGTVRASVEEEGMTMYVEFALTMYAAPATVIELTDAIVAINEELGTLTFNVVTGEGEGYYAELAGYTAPGVHEGPQICLFETPEAVAFANYVETSVADGVITLKGEFTSFMGAKFDVTISGKLPVEEPVMETVYFVNAQGWTGTINAYAWEPVQNANWPGAAATKEAEQINGYDVYSYTAEAGKYANIIFNGTGGQTADLKWTADKYYVLDGWYTKEEAEAKLATPIVDEVVYFVNNQKWSKVNAYAWDPANAAWPGKAATKEAEQIGGFDVYSYSAAPGTYQKVIFNDGGSNQTADMVWTAGKYIVNSKWYTKEEAEAALAAPVVTTWTMVGDAALFGTAWDLNATANDLVKQEDGTWVLTLTNKTLAAKSYEYKAAKDRSWNTTVPGGDNAKLTISKAGQYDVTFTLNAAATSVTAKATYIPAKYNVTVTAENGTVEGAGEYEEGATATLTATAAEGYEFVNWTKGEEVVSTENPYTFTVNADVALVANFQEVKPEPVEPLVKLTGDEEIYHFYLAQGVAVNTNPASPYYGYTYVTAATNGAADGGSDRADTQKRGIFVYDAELNSLNPDNVGFLPANADSLMTDASRQALHRIAINPVNDHVAFCYNVEGASAVWSMDPANLSGDAVNLIEGLAITKANAICFDAEGTLYVMDNANTATGGTIVKVVNGELVTVVQSKLWGVQDNSLVSDGRGGLWVAQNRWNIDTYSILTHVSAAGEVDFAVTVDSPAEVKALFTQVSNASYRGQCAYDAENHVLAFGGDKVVSLFKVYYDVITGVPSLEKLISTPAISNNIDGVAFYDNGDFAVVSASAERFMKFACNIEIPVQADLNGVVKRALTVGESTVVLTLEADGTPHIYNIKGENIAAVSLEGVIAVDTANLGDLLAISDIAVTEDGKLVATNYMVCQAPGYVDEGYIQGESRFYIWDNLEADPTVWFTSKMSSNWFRSKQGYTMAVKGTSQNAEIVTTGIHASKYWARLSSYRVIDGVFVEPDGNNNDYYHFMDVSDPVAAENVVGVTYQLNASPLAAMNWIIDAELINPSEIVEAEANNTEITSSVALSIDLGNKYQGATVVADGGQVLMVAPYANAEGLLAGVKVLDITAGLAADSVIATLDLEAPVAATAAATAVAIAAYDMNITLVADGNIYNFAAQLPKPERTEETVLNPFAYNLTSVLSEDKATLTVNYTLNANAEAVEIVILNGEDVVKTVACKGINKGAYTVNIPTAGLPETASLTWAVNVKGISPVAAVENPLNYSLYHPSGLDIDNNPENATFGMLLVNEGMQKVKDVEGYVSSGFGAGIFAFTPDFMPIMNDTLPGFNGGIEFTTGRADAAGSTAYSPRRIRISEDGRIFVTSLNTDGNYLWEVNPENMNEWTPVFQGTLNEQAELLTADSAFVAAPNAGFDVKGSGENLQLMMYSANIAGIGTAMNGFRCDEYNLGTATTWATAPSKNWVNGLYAINYVGTQVEYDNEGGIWIASYRGTASETNPGLVHINADGVEDAKLVWNNVRQAGIRFNSDFTKLVVAGNNGSAKKATIYAVSKDANGAPVLTEEMVINMATVGNNLNDFAFDYAGNLYSCGNSAEKIVSWAMPYSGEVSTPAAAQYAFQLTDPEPVYEVYEDEITNLVIDYDNLVLIGGPSANLEVDVYLGLGEYDMNEDKFQLLPESSVAIRGIDATFVEGWASVDGIAQTANAVVRCVWNEMNIELHLAMSAATIEPTVVVVENAAIEVEKVLLFGDMYDYALKMTGTWTDAEGLDYPVLVEVPVYYPEATEPYDMYSTVTVGGWGDDENWLGFGEGYLTITQEGDKITAAGVVENAMAGIAIDITISGTINNVPDGLENLEVTIKAVKLIKNGQLIIKKGDVEYNVQGAVVK